MFYVDGIVVEITEVLIKTAQVRGYTVTKQESGGTILVCNDDKTAQVVSSIELTNAEKILIQDFLNVKNNSFTVEGVVYRIEGDNVVNEDDYEVSVENVRKLKSIIDQLNEISSELDFNISISTGDSEIQIGCTTFSFDSVDKIVSNVEEVLK